ncbi:MAG: Sec-independent protein translocase protein TatB [Burkholderiales bacterium]
MLDFSVSEIGLIGVVALIAIGPERLPKVARTAGILLGRFRRYALSVKAEIDREIQQSELTELHKKMNEAVLEAERQVSASSQEAEKILNSPAVPSDLDKALEAPTAVLDSDAVQMPLPLEPQQTPFGGDPFSVRPAAPLRSKPMVPPVKPQTPESLAGPEAP